MPRGNDFQSNVDDLRGVYGEFENAEDMILAFQATFDPALRRAQLTKEVPAETDRFSEDNFALAYDALGSKVDQGEEILSVAVYGNALVAVVEDGNGDWRKEVGPANDRYTEPALSPAQAELRARHEEKQTIANEVSALRVAAEADLELAKAELRAEHEVAMDEVRAEAALLREQRLAEVGLSLPPVEVEPEAVDEPVEEPTEPSEQPTEPQGDVDPAAASESTEVTSEGQSEGETSPAAEPAEAPAAAEPKKAPAKKQAAPKAESESK